MHPSIRRAVACSACAALLAVSTVAAAQTTPDFPSRRVTFVVPFTPGGAGDLLARAMAPRLATAWGQPVVVENRPGAGGNTGSRTVATAPADGHTILIGSTSSHAINPALYGERMPYDVQRDFAAVVMVANSPHILLASPALPVTTLDDLIAHARAYPGKLNFSSGGNGTTTHLAGELLAAMTGTRMVHVPYRGAPEAVAGVLSGETQFMFENLAGALGHVRAGRLRALGVTSAGRAPQAPDLTPIAVAVPGFETGVWFGIFVPAATPASTTTRLNTDLLAAMQADDVRTQFDRLGMDRMGGTPADAARFMRDETTKWAKVVAASGATLK